MQSSTYVFCMTDSVILRHMLISLLLSFNAYGVGMRQLNSLELCTVSGGEHHDVTIIDPVAAVQTFLLLISVTDQQSFLYGSVITGMTVGAVGGGIVGYGFGAASAGLAGGIAAGLAGAAVGTIACGMALKGAAYFGIGAYNMIMGR